MNYSYPEYNIDFSKAMMDKCCEMGARLAGEVGLKVRHEEFLKGIRGKPGVRIEGDRVYFDSSLLESNIANYRAKLKDSLEGRKQHQPEDVWNISCGGYSMALRDVKTDEVRMATQQDLRDMIKLVNSFEVGGEYPVMPQDLPPLMRALSCFKICWESSDNINPYDYLDRKQTPYLYDMHQVMEKTFDVTLCVPSTMAIDEKDLQIFLDFYPKWKAGANIAFRVLDYPMLGITKPVTATGMIAMYIAELFSIYTLMNTFDPEVEVSFEMSAGCITDLRHACYAFGHPRQHAFDYITSRLPYALAGVDVDDYHRREINVQTTSSALDEHAALEKMGMTMLGALQGARSFSGLGTLCVDDLFSGVQFVIDMEMVSFVREAVEAFNPHPDIVSMDDDMYEGLKDICLGNDEFISCPDTVAKFKNIEPSSNRLVREKLRSWMERGKTLVGRARDEAIDRIRSYTPKFLLDDEKQEALDEIYSRAEKTLVG